MEDRRPSPDVLARDIAQRRCVIGYRAWRGVVGLERRKMTLALDVEGRA